MKSGTVGKINWLLAGLAALGVVGLFYYKQAGKLIFRPGTILGLNFSGSVPVVQFSVLIDNTSGTGATVNRIQGDLFSNGYKIATVDTPQTITVPPYGTGIANVTAELQILAIVNDLIRAFQYKNFTQDMTFTGTANVWGLQVPLNVQFTVG